MVRLKKMNKDKIIKKWLNMTIPCQYCGGSGEVCDGEYIEDCPVCGGKGKKKVGDCFLDKSFLHVFNLKTLSDDQIYAIKFLIDLVLKEVDK